MDHEEAEEQGRDGEAQMISDKLAIWARRVSSVGSLRSSLVLPSEVRRLT
jgi:hypothetical protein